MSTSEELKYLVDRINHTERIQKKIKVDVWHVLIQGLEMTIQCEAMLELQTTTYYYIIIVRTSRSITMLASKIATRNHSSVLARYRALHTGAASEEKLRIGYVPGSYPAKVVAINL